MSRNVLIVGATSAIAQSVARLYAESGARLFLAARSSAKLEVVAADLIARGASAVDIFVMDAENSTQIAAMQQAAWGAMGAVHIALVAYGSLPDQARAAADAAYLAHQFRINAESVLICLAGLAERLQSQGGGVLAVIGSAAGDRGRAANYLYGAAKAAIHAFASGLRQQLYARSVYVVTIKPGFVATPMTAQLNLPALLTARPDAVAARIVAAIERRRGVVYAPGFWWPIMLAIRMLPEAVFKRLKL